MSKQFAGLSGFPGLGVAQGLSNSLPFGQNLHPSGAFQPKVITCSLHVSLKMLIANLEVYLIILSNEYSLIKHTCHIRHLFQLLYVRYYSCTVKVLCYRET